MGLAYLLVQCVDEDHGELAGVYSDQGVCRIVEGHMLQIIVRYQPGVGDPLVDP